VKHIAVIGASLAGLSAVRALRQQGFDGAVTVVGDEPHRPYDRPPLSKQLLAGTIPVERLALERDGEDLGAQWRLGVRAVQLDPSGARIVLSDDTELAADGVVLATGASARRFGPQLSGVHVLRTVEDCLALRAELLPGARLVVIGAGFIGAEVASTASALGVHATVLEAAATPLSGPLGAEMGALVAGLHALHGVELHCGVPVSGLLGTDRVTGVALADGRELAADVVVIGVGAAPNVDWLRGSGLDVSDGVRCDAFGATALPQVVAAGDCAAWLDPGSGTHRRTEHWTSAMDRPAIAVAALLDASGSDHDGGAARAEPEPAPYFWSDQYGVKIQFAGHAQPGDSVSIELGDPASMSFLAVYRRGGTPVAVLGVSQVREFTRWRRQLV
jgi:NADPH-dependent 2,4-dienoyl-CoA reductase/sulfur reductase-like enzyme